MELKEKLHTRTDGFSARNIVPFVLPRRYNSAMEKGGNIAAESSCQMPGAHVKRLI
jgi:hypothetical protein